MSMELDELDEPLAVSFGSLTATSTEPEPPASLGAAGFGGSGSSGTPNHATRVSDGHPHARPR
jgi:hypothetical protein